MNCIQFRRKLLPALFLTLVSAFSYGQTHIIDSLRNRLQEEYLPSKQKEIVMKICEQNYSLSADSLLKYIELGKKYFALNTPDYFRLENFYCIYLFKTGKLNEALELTDTLLRHISSVNNSDKVRLEIILSRGSALIRNNQSKDAIQQSFNLLEAAEKSGDTLAIIKSYVLLGWANMEIGQYTEAIKWLNKGKTFAHNENILRQTGGLFSNMASSYNNINKVDSAFYFVDLALKYSRQSENLFNEANALNIRAAAYLKEENYAAAESDLKEALKNRELIGDPLYTISDMAQLSSFYAFINQPVKGIEIAQKGIALARKTHNIPKLIFLYSALSDNYNKANRKDEYATSLLTILGLKDSLYEKNSAEAIAVIETKYELQKKENIIIRQEYALTRNRYFTIGAIILLLLGGLLTWVLYKNYQLAQRRKMEAAMAEQKKLSTEAVQMAEENERKRIAADLHDNLGSYAAAISSNVKYLKEGMAPGTEKIITQLDENAQSMVTQLSDTIWVLKNENLPVTKLADRFKAWMLRLIQNFPNVKYHYTETIVNDIEFTPSKILHIFLMLKECVNNALRHSSASDIKINFESDVYWRITIEDNGIGTDINKVNKGSGIDNVRNRAAECGWNVEWQNVSPSGTRVIISGGTTK